MVMMICSSEPFSKCLWCSFAHSPLNLGWFCNCLCKIQVWTYYICFWGVFLQGFQWWGSRDVLWHPWNKVWSPSPGTFKIFCLQHFDFSVFEMLFIWSCQVMFHVIFFFKSALAYCHMQYGWFPTVVAPSWVSSSPTLLRLRNHRFTFMLIKFS